MGACVDPANRYCKIRYLMWTSWWLTAALLIEVHSFVLNVWPHGSTYSDIASQYLKYLNDRYGSIASEIVVVVDGNVGYSTKADEHAHRNQGVTM